MDKSTNTESEKNTKSTMTSPKKIITRQNALEIIWSRMAIILMGLVAVGVPALKLCPSDYVVVITLFIVGNIGGYVSMQRELASYTNNELVQLSTNKLCLILPPLIGGILSILMYVIFLSDLVDGALFPTFIADAGLDIEKAGFGSIFDQHAESQSDYAKLIFWGFVAGFNQNYVLNTIESLREKT